MMKKLFIFVLSLFLAVSLFSAEKPLLKIAITSDIHAQWKDLERVYAFFSAKNPDVVLFGGDLSRYIGDAESYKTYISIYNKHFSKCNPKPVHIPITGNHDYWEYKGVKRLSAQGSLERFFHPMGMKANWLQHHEVKGYTFIGISATDEKGENNHTPEEIKKVSELIGKAEKKAPGKPIFVLTHCPPAFTMAASERYEKKNKVWDWRYDHIRKMLAGHKQVVSISGHTHLTLQDERAIWQGEFTAFNAGILYKISPKKPGNLKGGLPVPDAFQGRSFSYIEVFQDHMLIYRYDVASLKEIKPHKRWKVDLPYDPAKAVYTMKRAESAVAPEFPANAKAEIIKEKTSYVLRLDRANHPDMVHAYKVHMKFDDKQKPLKFYIISDYYLSDRQKQATLQLPQKIKFVSGSKGIMKITPVETFGKEGKPLSVRFELP